MEGVGADGGHNHSEEGVSSMNLGPYRKAVAAGAIAVLIAGLTVFGSVFEDGVVTPQEWVTVALAVLGAIGVYFFPNDPLDAGP